MKKIFSLSSLFLIYASHVLAQNVGIGTNTPSYKLQVVHGGATGLNVKSTSTFSVVDIDGASGDAALRFQSNGVNLWNTRNAPADSCYEIFELGGGGERFRIQRHTGFVGIGGVYAPNANLHILGNSTLATPQLLLEESAYDSARMSFKNSAVSNFWSITGYNDSSYYNDRMSFINSQTGNLMTITGYGQVGIGTNAPTYKLDVLHSGSGGIRNIDTTSFSVIDIDGATGDAAIRFQKKGVNLWNTRNAPTDSCYQIFEMGGGGERFRIQRHTGFVGIGGASSPNANLHILGKSTSTTPQLLLEEFADDSARLSFKNYSVTNFWSITGYNNVSSYLDRLSFINNQYGNIMSLTGDGMIGVGTTTPTYKMQIVHGGSTGLNVKSSSSFSVVDIDGASGDAALRFQSNGVNLWNTRNAPTDSCYQIFELGGGGERFRIQRHSGFVGIHQPFPAAQLDVNGTFKLTDGTQAAGKVLTSDAAGNATWRNNTNRSIGITMRTFTGTVSVPTSTFTPLTTWSTIQNEDGGANYNASTGEYTITDTATYQINASVVWSPVATVNASSYAMLYCYINGISDYWTSQPVQSNSSYNTLSMNFSRRLNANDKVSFRVYQSSGTTMTLSSGYYGQNFSIQYLHK